MRIINLLAIAVLLLLPMTSFAETIRPDQTSKKETQTHKIAQIVVISNPIFDESDPDAFFIHNWANYLHINTQESVILDKLSFSALDSISLKDLEEAQRLLRYEPYIRDAKIRFTNRDPDADVEQEGEVILVETWDNWSMLPTFSASHSGGESNFSAGIKEDNLFGLGIRTQFKYSSDEERNGYKFAFRMPIHYFKHSTLSANFYDNDDGQSKSVSFSRPFYTLDGELKYSFSYADTIQTDTLKQNGEDINEFEHKFDFFDIAYGWRLPSTKSITSRVIMGVTQDFHKFDNVQSYPISEVPQDREFLYPWIAYQYIEDQFQTLRNIHLINYNEDFNLGWQHYFKLGLETKDTSDKSSVGYHMQMKTSRGYRLDNQLTLFNLNAISTLATSQKDFYKISIQAEHFYQFSDKWTGYTKARLSSSQNNYLDRPFALGDDTGVRGYPNQYQYGDKQWLFTAELRNYPNISLYQLAEIGWATFIDLGRAFGGSDENNEHKDVIGSFGIGARVFSSRSSYGNVAHIDLSVPFSSGNKVNGWEWRFVIKQKF